MEQYLLSYRSSPGAALADYCSPVRFTKVSDRTLDLTTDQWNLLASLNPVLHVLQVATTYSSTENNVSTCISAVLSIVHGLTKSMEITEDDPPAIYLNVISVRKVREGGNLMNSM